MRKFSMLLGLIVLIFFGAIQIASANSRINENLCENQLIDSTSLVYQHARKMYLGRLPGASIDTLVAGRKGRDELVKYLLHDYNGTVFLQNHPYPSLVMNSFELVDKINAGAGAQDYLDIADKLIKPILSNIRTYWIQGESPLFRGDLSAHFEGRDELRLKIFNIVFAIFVAHIPGDDISLNDAKWVLYGNSYQPFLWSQRNTNDGLTDQYRILRVYNRLSALLPGRAKLVLDKRRESIKSLNRYSSVETVIAAIHLLELDFPRAYGISGRSAEQIDQLADKIVEIIKATEKTEVLMYPEVQDLLKRAGVSQRILAKYTY